MGRLLSGNRRSTTFFIILGIFAIKKINVEGFLQRSIKPSGKSCKDALGEQGLCVFKWDCIIKDGVLLSTCTDGFLFGTCCKFRSNKTSHVTINHIRTNTRHPSYQSISSHSKLPHYKYSVIPHRTTPYPILITWTGSSPPFYGPWYPPSRDYTLNYYRDTAPYRNRFSTSSSTNINRYSPPSYYQPTRSSDTPTVISSNYMIIFDSNVNKPTTNVWNSQKERNVVTINKYNKDSNVSIETTGTGYYTLPELDNNEALNNSGTINGFSEVLPPLNQTYATANKGLEDIDIRNQTSPYEVNNSTKANVEGTEITYLSINENVSDPINNEESAEYVTFVTWSTLLSNSQNTTPSRDVSQLPVSDLSTKVTANLSNVTELEMPLNQLYTTEATLLDGSEIPTTEILQFDQIVPSLGSAPTVEPDTSVVPSTVPTKSVLLPSQLQQNKSTDIGTRKPMVVWNYKKQCGVRSLKPHGRIVGGLDTYFGKWPWQVLVKEATWLGIFIKNKCGGVLINAKYVLTAAHCQPGFLSSLIVVLGEHDLTGDFETLVPLSKNVRKMIVHRNYNSQTFENDIALLQLDSPVEFQPHIVAICLPEANEDFTGKMAFVSGWGKLSHGGTIPTVLQEVNVPIVTNSKCQKMFLAAGHVKAIRDTFVCAGYEKGGQDSCEGDSGGPLMTQRNNGLWVLVGTVSHGIRCADPNLPGVYMRTSAYKTWIETIVKNG